MFFMLQKIRAKEIELIHLGFLCSLIGLVFSKALLSLSTAYLVLIILLSCDLKNRIIRLKENKIAISIIVLFGWISLSIIWSINLNEGIIGITSKLNLILLPICWVTAPQLNAIKRKQILFFFCILVVGATLFNIIHYSVYETDNFDRRSLSYFISHIRFSILVALSVFILLIKLPDTKFKIITLLTVAWLIFYSIYSLVGTGLAVLVVGFAILGLNLIIKYKFSKTYLIIGLLSVLLLVTFYFISLFKDINTAPKRINEKVKTSLGNPYDLNPINKDLENGNYIYKSICKKEIDENWIKYSKVSLEQINQNGYTNRHILYRYLTSKGLRKDSEGLKKLDKIDIENIEKGIPSTLETSTIENKVKNIIRELLTDSANPNGHSILQRKEYWKTSLELIKENMLIGTGIGDYRDEFDRKYEKNNSLLHEKNRFQSHNQWLSIFVMSGLIGFTLFFRHLILFFLFLFSEKNLLGIIFFLISVTSFIVEDTLFTLTGMSFYGFFVGYFITENKK